MLYQVEIEASSESILGSGFFTRAGSGSGQSGLGSETIFTPLILALAEDAMLTMVT